jgi:CheY-like chemotaxis protein
MDMRLPDIDGNSAIRILHQLYPNMEFLIHTGSSSYSLPDDLRAIGLDDDRVYQKPLSDMAPLAAAVRSLSSRESSSMNTPAVRVLTIDDEPMVRDIFSVYLEDSGFEVIQASDGPTGIDLIRRERPDLVLCDLRMPGMDGLQVLATVTREFPDLPILVVSGMGGMSDAIQALKFGAWDYVTKPIEDMAVLEHAIAHALGTRPAAPGKPRAPRTSGGGQ